MGLFCADDGSSRHLPLRGEVRLTSKSAMFFPSQTLSVSASPWLMNGLLSLGCPSPAGRGALRRGGARSDREGFSETGQGLARRRWGQSDVAGVTGGDKGTRLSQPGPHTLSDLFR